MIDPKARIDKPSSDVGLWLEFDRDGRSVLLRATMPGEQPQNIAIIREDSQGRIDIEMRKIAPGNPLNAVLTEPKTGMIMARYESESKDDRHRLSWFVFYEHPGGKKAWMNFRTAIGEGIEKALKVAQHNRPGGYTITTIRKFTDKDMQNKAFKHLPRITPYNPDTVAKEQMEHYNGN